MTKFWNWIKNEDTGETELYFEGPISDCTWLGDEITPKLFKDELSKHPGDLTVWLCSPGGDVFAASQIRKISNKFSLNLQDVRNLVNSTAEHRFLLQNLYVQIAVAFSVQRCGTPTRNIAV